MSTSTANVMIPQSTVTSTGDSSMSLSTILIFSSISVIIATLFCGAVLYICFLRPKQHADALKSKFMEEGASKSRLKHNSPSTPVTASTIPKRVSMTLNEFLKVDQVFEPLDSNFITATTPPVKRDSAPNIFQDLLDSQRLKVGRPKSWVPPFFAIVCSEDVACTKTEEMLNAMEAVNSNLSSLNTNHSVKNMITYLIQLNDVEFLKEWGYSLVAHCPNTVAAAEDTRNNSQLSQISSTSSNINLTKPMDIFQALEELQFVPAVEEILQRATLILKRRYKSRNVSLAWDVLSHQRKDDAFVNWQIPAYRETFEAEDEHERNSLVALMDLDLYPTSASVESILMKRNQSSRSIAYRN